MPLNHQDFVRLREMQTLCTQLEADVQQLAAFGKSLAAIDQRYKALATLYQAHWLRLSESKALSKAQCQQIEDMVAKGSYSVLGQDTIWNALSDTRAEYLRLLKSLAEKIE